MLMKRTITAIILISAVLLLLFHTSVSVFTFACRALMFALLWECTGVMGMRRLWQRLAWLLLGALLLYVFAHNVPMIFWWSSLMLWGIAMMAISLFPRGQMIWQRSWLSMAFALWMMLAACLGFTQLRHAQQGQWHLLQLLILVWSVDIGAYFFGRFLGKRRFLPAVSPNKTWAGFLGALLTVIAIAFVLQWTLHLLPHWDDALFLSVCIWLATIVGDFFESMLKRCYNVKDSGHFLPGHGGLWDRLDGLLAAVPIYVVVARFMLQ